jgi:hypothetical protein
MEKYQIAKLASFFAAHSGKVLSRQEIQTLERLALPSISTLGAFLCPLAQGRRSSAIKAFQTLSGVGPRLDSEKLRPPKRHY